MCLGKGRVKNMRWRKDRRAKNKWNRVEGR